MQSLRRLILSHGRLAAMLLVCALVVKMAVPAGWMVETRQGRLTVTLCSGVAPKPVAAAMHGMAHHDAGAGAGHEKSDTKPDMPCAFAGLSAGTLGGVDPALLILALAVVAALALLPFLPPRLYAAPRLRPPLRGPPPILRLR